MCRGTQVFRTRSPLRAGRRRGAAEEPARRRELPGQGGVGKRGRLGAPSCHSTPLGCWVPAPRRTPSSLSADFREDPLFLPTEVRRFWKNRGTSKDPSLPTRRISPGSFSWGGGGCWGEGPHSSISVGCRNGGTHLGAYLQCGLPGLRLGMKRRLELTRPGADSQMARKLSQDVN